MNTRALSQGVVDTIYATYSFEEYQEGIFVYRQFDQKMIYGPAEDWGEAEGAALRHMRKSAAEWHKR